MVIVVVVVLLVMARIKSTHCPPPCVTVRTTSTSSIYIYRYLPLLPLTVNILHEAHKVLAPHHQPLPVRRPRAATRARVRGVRFSPRPADVVGAVGRSIAPSVHDPRDGLRHDVGHVAEQGEEKVGRRLVCFALLLFLVSLLLLRAHTPIAAIGRRCESTMALLDRAAADAPLGARG